MRFGFFINSNIALFLNFTDFEDIIILCLIIRNENQKRTYLKISSNKKIDTSLRNIIYKYITSLISDEKIIDEGCNNINTLCGDIPNIDDIVYSLNLLRSIEKIKFPLIKMKETKEQLLPTELPSKVVNYSFIDFNKITKFIPFNDIEFSEIERATPQILLQKDKVNKKSFYTTYEELSLRIEKFNLSRSYIDKYLLVRYAIGFSGNTERAWTFLKSYIEYKESHIDKLLLLTEDERIKKFTLEMYNNLFINLGSDIYGRRILYIKANMFSPKKISKENLVDLLIIKLEEALSLLPKNIDKVLIMIDLAGSNSSNSSMSHFKLTQEVMNKCFVERMANLIIIINKGFFFKFLWNIISSFVPERVIKKIIVIDDKNKALLKKTLGDDIFSSLSIK